MQSTMQPFPLTVAGIFRHGCAAYGDSEIITLHEDGAHRARFSDVAERTTRLAHALARLGVRPGDRVGTFLWNSQKHLEAYLAVPSMGAVLHTLNIRLFAGRARVHHQPRRGQGGPRRRRPRARARARAALLTLKPERFIVVGDGDASALGGELLRYESPPRRRAAGFDWP